MKIGHDHLPQFHGGLRAIGRRKLRRPLSFRRPVQVCLKSEKARGELSLGNPRHRRQVKEILRRQARRHGVSLRSALNFGNQIHLIVRIRDRRGFQNFLRSSSALIARKITGAKKGHSYGKFWQALASSRVLASEAQGVGIIRFLSKLYLQMKGATSVAERNSISVELWSSSA